ncbi:hypothetical protein EGR_09461 [Echinococcus granulosus]|uniref:Uncharacterized protein n=1 Tax=Echinococcus granulosus TaxID=6210 RepID=W6U571_ECHGR|nr:hypothetical protein EGR_09461 [Echinococcus granulosus]EUB55701.1 hypothetical protein EGR_09461 [Echinococcus granulosus]
MCTSSCLTILYRNWKTLGREYTRIFSFRKSLECLHLTHSCLEANVVAGVRVTAAPSCVVGVVGDAAALECGFPGAPTFFVKECT